MNEQLMRKFEVATKVFRPAAPIDNKDLFAGRTDYIFKCYSVINQPGRHCILYGNRGVGKTSFANVMKIITGSTLISVKISCDTHDNYQSLWRKILSQIPVSFTIPNTTIGFNANIREDQKKQLTANDLLKNDTITIQDIKLIFDFIASQIFIIIDEFDRLNLNFDRALFADSLKYISDTMPGVTLLLVGVADDVNELIGEHLSIQRNIVQIHLPTMSVDELKEIIEKGLKELELEIEDDSLNSIINYSDGYPHYTHLLAYNCSINCLRHERKKITKADLNYSINEAISDAHETLRNSYEKATLATKKNIYKEVLWASADAKLDLNQSFQALDLIKNLEKYLNKPMKITQFGFHLGQLCSEERGEILKAVGSKNRKRYKFANPLMRPFIKMIIYRDKTNSRE